MSSATSATPSETPAGAGPCSLPSGRRGFFRCSGASITAVLGGLLGHKAWVKVEQCLAQIILLGVDNGV